MNIASQINKKNILIFSILTYFISTYLLYRYGPLEYTAINRSESSVFVIVYFLVFVIGYYLSYKIRICKEDPIIYNENQIIRLLKVGFLLSSLFSIIFLIRFTNSLNPIIIVKNLFLGVINPEIGYSNNLNMEKKSSIFTQLSTLVSPITYAIIPLGIYYFKKLSFRTRSIMILVILLEILQFVIKGTNFGVFKMTVTVITSLAILISYKKIKLRKYKIILPIVILLILFFVFYLLKTVSSRLGYSEIPNTYMGLIVNKDHLLFKILPISLSIPIFIATTYLSQGFHGFSLVFNYPFTSTYGLGNGRFLISYGEKIFGIDLWSRTYQAKMDSVWSSRVSWHTFFTWFANDVGVYGVILVMFILGILFGLVVKDAYKNNSIIAITLLPLYVILLIFIPANNIVFDNPTLFMPFVIINIIWFINLSKRYTVHKKEAAK